MAPVCNKELENLLTLLESGADVDPTNPLHWAAKCLFVYGKTPNEFQPLHWAASNGEAETVKILLDYSIDANVHDMWGNSPLHATLRSSETEAAKILMEYGADVNARNNEGQSPLQLAIEEDSSVDMVMLLLERGANTKLRDSSGTTPQRLALYHQRHEISKLLAANTIQAAWRAHRRNRAARVIQRHWIQAYWDPAYRVCLNRLHRRFAELMADTVALRTAH